MLPLPLASLPATLAAEGPQEVALLALPASRVTTVSLPPFQGAAHTTWSIPCDRAGGCPQPLQRRAQGTGGGWFSQGSASTVRFLLPWPHVWVTPLLWHYTFQQLLLPNITAVVRASHEADADRRRGHHHAPRAASCPRCTWKRSGMGRIQHRGPQPAGSLTTPVWAAAGPGHLKRHFRGGLRLSTHLGLAPMKCPPLKHAPSPAGKSPLTLGTPTQEQGGPWGFLVSPAWTALLH